MIITRSIALHTAQEVLKRQGFYSGKIDGQIGPATTKAARSASGQKPILAVFISIGGERLALAYLQHYLNHKGYQAGAVDGYFGPSTAEAVAQYTSPGLCCPDRSDESAEGRSYEHGWPNNNTNDIRRVFGEAGTGIVMVDLPYPLRLAWDPDTRVTRTQCHNLVAKSLVGIFEDTHRHYGEMMVEELQLTHFGGCYNYRVKRGGSTLSTHAWGVAFDIDPLRNQLRQGATTASLARPEYNAFWNIVGSYGWSGLGPAKDYDWMHVQAARI